MTEYICKGKITVPKIDEDGFETDERINVPIGSKWHIETNSDYEVYLENELGDWLGMGKIKFEENFEGVEKE